MELVGASYLYALSTISMTFVGYARLLLALRETPGHAISSYDTYFTLSFMQAGFIVTAGGLMPQLLAFCQLPLPWVWRLSSAAISIPIALFVAVTPRRRRRAVQEPVPCSFGYCSACNCLQRWPWHATQPTWPSRFSWRSTRSA